MVTLVQYQCMSSGCCVYITISVEVESEAKQFWWIYVPYQFTIGIACIVQVRILSFLLRFLLLSSSFPFCLV